MIFLKSDGDIQSNVVNPWWKTKHSNLWIHKMISLSGQIWPVEVMVLAGLYLIKLAIWPPTMEVYNVVSMAGFSLIGTKIH